jgi:hypothetical protein
VYGEGPAGLTETVRGAFDWSTKTGWVVVGGSGRMELVQIGAALLPTVASGIVA